MYLSTAAKGGKVQLLHCADVDMPARAVTTVSDSATAAELLRSLNGVEADPSSSFWRSRLAELTGSVPAAVAAALTSEAGRYDAGVERMWTVFGHWDGDRIVVEFSVPGGVHDSRVDGGTWPEGLWCDSATGFTEAEACARAVAGYETDLLGYCAVCSGSGLALPPGAGSGELAECWFCHAKPLS